MKQHGFTESGEVFEDKRIDNRYTPEPRCYCKT